MIAHSTLQAQQILKPEELSGRWETADAHGGTVGIDIQLHTYIENKRGALNDAPQRLLPMSIGVYQRSKLTATSDEENGFSNTPDGGALWDGQHLRIDYGRRNDPPGINVDVVWNERASTWTGSFQRGYFRRQVVLKRSIGKQLSPFAGTWMNGNGSLYTCLHIAQQLEGGLVGWSDSIQVPGRARYRQGLQPPAEVPERYGERAKITMDASDLLTVELHPYSPACCSYPFAAKLSPDKRALQATWPLNPKQDRWPATWHKVDRISCTQAAERMAWSR